MSDAIEAFARVRIDALLQVRPVSSGRFVEAVDVGCEERPVRGRVQTPAVADPRGVESGASRFEKHWRTIP